MAAARTCSTFRQIYPPIRQFYALQIVAFINKILVSSETAASGVLPHPASPSSDGTWAPPGKSNGYQKQK
jgi:hypothetical protein